MKHFLTFLLPFLALQGDDNRSLTLMPYAAFGRQTNNNIYVVPQNRLNPTQTPQTNNLQIYQTLFPTLSGLAPTNEYSGSGAGGFFRSAFRLGQHFGNIGLSGPGIIFPANSTVDFDPAGAGESAAITPSQYGRGQQAQISIDATTDDLGYNRPSINTSIGSINLIFSAFEVASNNSGFDPNTLITTLDDYGQSLRVQYFLPTQDFPPNPNYPGYNAKCAPTTGVPSVTDYVVMGNLFHDVYYDRLTPLLISNVIPLQGDGSGTSVIVGYFNGSTLEETCVTGTFPFTVTGNKFILTFVNDLDTIDGPITQQYRLLIYLEAAGDQKDYSFTVGNNDGHSNWFLRGTEPYTGWMRAIFLPLEEDPIIVGGDIPNGFTQDGFYTCIPESSDQTLQMLNQNWATIPIVQAIATQPYSLYTLFPYQWTNKLIGQILAQMNPGTTFPGCPTPSNCPIPPDACGNTFPVGVTAPFGWLGNLQGTYQLMPNGQSLALMLPFLTFDDGTYTFSGGLNLFQIAQRMLFDMTTTFNAGAWGGQIPTPPSPMGDSSASMFTTIFNMGFNFAHVSDIESFQNDLCRPIYSVTAPSYYDLGVVSSLDEYRSAIPTAISGVSFTTNQATIQYDVASITSPIGPNTTQPLILFPGWFNVQGDILNLRYDSAIKGQMFAAPATAGTPGVAEITFLENDWLTWLEDGDFAPPAASLSDLFGSTCEGTVIESYLQSILDNSYLPWNPLTNSPAPPIVPWPADVQSGAFIQPLFLDASTVNDGYATGKVLFQLVKTAQTISLYMTLKGSYSSTDIQNATAPLIDYVKRYLFDFFVNRPDTQNYLALDGDNHGVCFYGDPIDSFDTQTSSVANPPYISNLGFEQQADNLPDFGNAIYNDHILQYGYYMQAVAGVIEWDIANTATVADRFIRIPVLGADGNLYSMRHFIDMIWRDTLNPYLTGVDDFPFLRGYFLWAGHGAAGGMENIDPSSGSGGVFMSTGRNLESIAECYNTIMGVMFYAKAVLDDNTSAATLTPDQVTLYQNLQSAMLMLCKMTSSTARVLWYLIGKGYRTSLSDPDVDSFFTPYYLNYSITTGNVNDTGTNESVAFTSGGRTGNTDFNTLPPVCTPAPAPPSPAPPPIPSCSDVNHGIVPAPPYANPCPN